MKFYEYLPNFFEGFDKEVVDIKSHEDALKTTTCKRWASSSKFDKFVIEPYDQKYMVRAFMKDGTKWVVGFIK